MSRTHKDKPYRLGGQRHKYYVVNNHGSHGKFTLVCRRLRRAREMAALRSGEEKLPPRNAVEFEYFD